MSRTMQTSTPVSHYRQTKSSSGSLEESNEFPNALYNSNDTRSRAQNTCPSVHKILQPRNNTERLLWILDADARATGRHQLQPPTNNQFQTQGRTIYDAPRRPAHACRQQSDAEPKTPVRSTKKHTLLSARTNVSSRSRGTPVIDLTSNTPDTGVPLHVGVSQALVVAMQTNYASSSRSSSTMSSPTPSLTYSEGSDSGEEDMPSIELAQAPPLSGYDCFSMDYESSPNAYYRGEIAQYPQLNMEAEIAKHDAAVLAQQEDMQVKQTADMLFMQYINVDDCADVSMDF